MKIGFPICIFYFAFWVWFFIDWTQTKILVVADEGCGIPPKDLRKLGTPFFTTKDSGTGLVLATCYKVEESHNSKIHVDSSSRGTTFFPLRRFIHKN